MRRSAFNRLVAQALRQGHMNTTQVYNWLNKGGYGGFSMYELPHALNRSRDVEQVGFDKRAQVLIWGLKS